MIVPLQLDDGSILYADAWLADPEQKVAGRVFDLASVTAAIRAAATELSRALKSIAPDEIELEVGVELAIKDGALIAVLVRGSATTTLKVRLKWNPAQDDR